ncbi:hypothetical protein ACTA71_002631 [Dictyostelium dimigraforme]
MDPADDLDKSISKFQNIYQVVFNRSCVFELINNCAAYGVPLGYNGIVVMKMVLQLFSNTGLCEVQICSADGGTRETDPISPCNDKVTHPIHWCFNYPSRSGRIKNYKQKQHTSTTYENMQHQKRQQKCRTTTI